MRQVAFLNSHLASAGVSTGRNGGGQSACDLISQSGPCHQILLGSTSVEAETPLEHKSAGFSFPGTNLQELGVDKHWIVCTRLATNGFRLFDGFWIQDRATWESDQKRQMMSDDKDFLIDLANRADRKHPINSRRGSVILLIGATLVRLATKATRH